VCTLAGDGGWREWDEGEPAEQYKRELMVSHFVRHRFASEQRAGANISKKEYWDGAVTSRYW
jgi:hypothetical protein